MSRPSSPGRGDVIDGRYRLVRQLGEGGAGSVFEARTSEGATVALKLLDPALSRRPDMRERFEREARVLNGLAHPHLIRFLDYGVAEGVPYISMELLSGKPLDALLASRPLPPAIAFELAVGVTAGLAYAHAHGVLHRDLKPANIFVAVLPGGTLHPKLLDFGLARFFNAERWGAHATLTADGAVMGTPHYMPPEQALGERADARSDVYAMGVVLYELFAARPPFDADTVSELMRLHLLTPPPPVEQVRPGLELQPALWAVISRALAKRVEDRFPSAGEMLRALQEVPEPAAHYG